ncbi:CBS domain-containing protein [Gammaproteobacteria bacterium]|nr:CBS domain-containing protein [Gammaproteobacteria bacterium]
MKENNFSIKKDKSIRDALKQIELNGLGLVFIEDRKKIIGVITDGDIRRALIKNKNLNISLSSFMNKKFTFLSKGDDTRENILKLLDSRIKAIPILDANDKLINVVSSKNINWNENTGIISKAKSPVRITFAGGGTDLTAYFYESNGIVFNATINKFTHAILEKREDSKINITSHDLDQTVKVENISELKLDGNLDLIKSIIINLAPNFGFNLYTYSDVPPGSGLGGSAVLASAIIGAFNNFREIKLDVYEIVELAFHSERIVLKLNGGWQDQYATVFGGFNYIEFNGKSNTVNPLRIKDDIKDELEDSLLLCYTGKNHNSGDIHNDIKKRMKTKNEKEYAQKTKEIAYQMKSSLLQGKIGDFGGLLGEAWEAKKKFSKKISNKFLDQIYSYAIKSGAVGGKLLGAGDGGYFLFYVPTHKKIDFIKLMKKKKLFVEPFTFDDNGLRSWTTKNKI